MSYWFSAWFRGRLHHQSTLINILSCPPLSVNLAPVDFIAVPYLPEEPAELGWWDLLQPVMNNIKVLLLVHHMEKVCMDEM